jgi:ElaB/YqjD/DUF883 family membrane-anchored ribosome-binding protein
MPKSLTGEIKHSIQDAVEEVAKTLRAAADNLSDDAEDAIAEAAQALRKAAHDLVESTPEDAERFARLAAEQVKAHPLATAAVALSAAAALITALGVARKKLT